MTLLSDLIDIPERVHQGDFVLRLTEGVRRSRETLDQYVVTPELVQKFDQALDFIKEAVASQSSKAAYLHGSFGSGKSHFMAVLYLLLQHDADARSVSELAPVIGKHDAWVEGKKFLLVPYHLIGATNLESAILGGYVEHVKRLHPDSGPPAVFLSGKILDNAERLRESLGDQAFFDALNRSVESGDGGWGALETAWDRAAYDQARSSPAGDADRLKLVSDVLATFLTSYPEIARATGEGYVTLDEGLSAISHHAKELGYDALILFLDELILWLASHAGDLRFLDEEGQKLAKLVEPSNPDRPTPIVSFVARQRDLRELVGEHVPGAEKLGFSDILKWWEGRFHTITLEDRNLPAIVEKRVLRPKDEEARVALDQAFRETEKTRKEILEILRGQEGDREAFRKVYPFSPALVDTLVALSSLLQRERTALKLLLQILVDQRASLKVGDLVPVGDLWDVLESGDEPFSEDVRQRFEAARKLYREKLEPLLRSEHHLTRDDSPTEPFRNDARLAKTLLLAALAPEADALKALDATRLVALNHGSIRSPIPGQEQQMALAKIRKWVSAGIGEIRLGDGGNPTITVQLTGVDVESILLKVQGEDNQGNRRQKIREMVSRGLGLPTRDELFGEHEHDVLWRGTRRTVRVLFGNVRELPDASLGTHDEWWKIVLDYPFDPENYGPSDDIARLQEFNDDALTICWLPSFFSAAAQQQLGRLVLIDHVLKGERFEQLAAHLSTRDRQTARVILENLQSQLREVFRSHLEAAYGIRSTNGEAVDPAHRLDGAEHFYSLKKGFHAQPPVGATLRDAFENLVKKSLDHQFPKHPTFLTEEVKLGDVRKVFEELERAVEMEGGRVRVEESKRRDLLRQIAEPLELGEMHEAFFLLKETWRNHFERKAAAEGGEMTVAKLRASFDDPEPRGLPRPLQDLVVLVFAAQTNRSFWSHSTPVTPLIDQGLKGEYVLKQEPLPSQDEWDRCLERAARLFGVAPVSKHLTANNVGDAAAKVRAALEGFRVPAQRMVDELANRVRKLGIPDDAPRLRTGREAARLIAELGDTEDAKELVSGLGSRTIENDLEKLARSLSHSEEVANALRDTPWDIFEGAWKTSGKNEVAALKNREAVADLLARDELAVPLASRLRELREEATRILSAAHSAVAPPAITRVSGRRPVEAGSSEDLGTEEARRLFDRIVGLLEEDEARRLSVTWSVTEPTRDGSE